MLKALFGKSGGHGCCEDCRWWDHGGKGQDRCSVCENKATHRDNHCTGLCRIAPPDPKHKWPLTGRLDWCGAHDG